MYNNSLMEYIEKSLKSILFLGIIKLICLATLKHKIYENYAK